jgi:hypothetical protein
MATATAKDMAKAIEADWGDEHQLIERIKLALQKYYQQGWIDGAKGMKSGSLKESYNPEWGGELPL